MDVGLFAEPWDKIVCLTCLFTLLQFFFFLSSLLLTCDVALSTIHILDEQSSEENFFLSSPLSNLVLIYTNFIIRPSLCYF
jgi:hypothetical protein